MLRPTSFAVITLVCVILGATSLPAQPKGGETVLSRCWQFPAENLSGLISWKGQIFATSEDGRIVSVSSSGDKLWETELGGEVEPGLAITDGVLLISTRSATGETVLRRLSVQTGLPIGVTPAKEATATDALPATRASIGDIQIIGDDHGRITAEASDGTLIWRFKTGAAVSAVLAVNDAVVAISRDNFVYSLSARNGGLRWKRRLQGRVAHYGVSGTSLLVSSVDQHGASLIDAVSGRVIGKVVMSTDEDLIADPLLSTGGFILATPAGLSGYSVTGCSTK